MIDEKNLEWLIRDTSNVIRGPYKHSEVAQLIKKGQLKGKTEISRANSYWFAIEEKAELAVFFPELGLKPAEDTRMTSTLSHVNPVDQGVEITQFTEAPTRKELIEKTEDSPKSSEKKMEWLNSDFAEEFGEERSILLEAQTNLKNKTENDAQMSSEEEVKRDLLSRATVKADTLPSEHKDFSGDRPKSISSVIKGPDKSLSAIQQSSSYVTVPVEAHEGQAKILTNEDEAAAEDSGRRKKLVLVSGVIAVSLIFITAAFVFFNTESTTRSTRSRKAPGSGASEGLVRKSLVLFQLEGAKEALADFELEPNSKGNPTLPMAHALVKKEFLYDADGALVALQTARSLIEDAGAQSEVDNLLANYRFERERDGSIETYRQLVDAFPEESIFRYNLALAKVRSGREQEAIQDLSGSLANLPRQNALAEDVSILMGWARELVSKGRDSAAEAAYQKALSVNPSSAKARLGLAIHRLRRGGMKESEADFRSFLDALPDLDPPTRVPNYRKMSDFDFYNFARSQLRDLNIPLGAAGPKPSPLVMAVDAVLSCLQSRTGEAEKILESALSAAPGDFHLMKAVGYHRWKEGRYPEIIDLLKDLPKEKNSFAINLLLGKAYLKTGRRDKAEFHYRALTTIDPKRSEGWSLLGDLQLQQGQVEIAKANFVKALEREPLDIIALRGLDRLGEPDVISPGIAANLPF